MNGGCVTAQKIFAHFGKYLFCKFATCAFRFIANTEDRLRPLFLLSLVCNKCNTSFIFLETFCLNMKRNLQNNDMLGSKIISSVSLGCSKIWYIVEKETLRAWD